jgi:hypothetical protein
MMARRRHYISFKIRFSFTKYVVFFKLDKVQIINALGYHHSLKLMNIADLLECYTASSM